MGFYPLFASVSESQVLTNYSSNKTNIDQVLNLPLHEVMSVVEWKKAEEKTE
jgi:hypothetical protein